MLAQSSPTLPAVGLGVLRLGPAALSFGLEPAGESGVYDMHAAKHPKVERLHKQMTAVHLARRHAKEWCQTKSQLVNIKQPYGM